MSKVQAPADDDSDRQLRLKEGYGVAGFHRLLVVLKVSKVSEKNVDFILRKLLDADMEHHITGNALAATGKAEGFRMSDVTVRAVVSECRCSERYPIASYDDGYWLASKPEHIDMTIAHIEKRIARELSAIEGLRAMRADMVAEQQTEEGSQ